ncbi:MAG TPA: 16S rRNA (adenine(1518)-N(6)/adenine(1519)-N(6))-dimethyltransferase RsmA [Candidatus Peribacterales bacterium]|nr:16S rRNA (adenine(1518)-N(6)/adenine(1519)-N(6))-dimethyltransferase RsmA [Candidatus Peribacterales bacterium]
MSDIAAFLRKKGLRLNTDLGQHFLQDEGVLRAIVEAAKIDPSDHIVEIGAGVGVLTKELTGRAKQVTAVELDRRLIDLLKEYTGNPPNLTIVEGNALQVSFPESPYKIVANIPYHITSPLLRHAFLPARSERSDRSGGESQMQPKSMTLLIQREVAEKICDQKDHGLLTILVSLFGTPRVVRIVHPGAFIPPPKVDSAVLHIDCFPKPKADPKTIDELFVLTKAAFSQKRKMLRNTIGEMENGMDRLKKADIDAMRRPQTLSIEEWIKLAQIA